MAKRISFSIVFIIFCLFVLTVGQFLPIEITSGGLSFVLYFVVLLGFPIIAIKELRKWFRTLKNKTTVEALKVVTICVVGLYIPFALFFSFGNAMCANITDETLFVKKNEKTSKIILRHYECGASSGGGNYEVVKVVDIYAVLDFVTKVDTAKIDRNVWSGVVRSN